jgi:hypothetical protein
MSGEGGCKIPPRITRTCTRNTSRHFLLVIHFIAPSYLSFLGLSLCLPLLGYHFRVCPVRLFHLVRRLFFFIDFTLLSTIVACLPKLPLSLRFVC